VNRINVMLETLGGNDIVPEAVYYKAVAYYTWGKHTEAIQTAKRMVGQYPRSGFADDALFVVAAALEAQKSGGFLGLFSRGHHKEAIQAYQLLITSYPTSSTLPEAWFRLGLNLERARQRATAIEAYQTVVQQYPGTAAALKAAQRLSRLGDS